MLKGLRFKGTLKNLEKYCKVSGTGKRWEEPFTTIANISDAYGAPLAETISQQEYEEAEVIPGVVPRGQNTRKSCTRNHLHLIKILTNVSRVSKTYSRISVAWVWKGRNTPVIVSSVEFSELCKKAVTPTLKYITKGNYWLKIKVVTKTLNTDTEKIDIFITQIEALDPPIYFLSWSSHRRPWSSSPSTQQGCHYFCV